jgi:metal-responsive CopG/Arc/MetJ family transcriptional regulator
MARTQIMVQLTTELLDLLDRRAAKEGKSRSELIRLAVEQYFRTDIEAQIDEAIRDGYRRVPPTDEFDALADAGARRVIGTEPW